MEARSMPIWLGVTGVVITVAAMAGIDASASLAAAVSEQQMTWRAPMQFGLRASFLLISIGAIWRLQSTKSTPWKWAVAAALTILVCGVAIELVDVRALGASDSLEWRLFRLGAMAAYAVPMLALLAAGEQQDNQALATNRLAIVLLRLEPFLFAVGASTLATILLAAAFINKELAWLAPIGADTTVAACAAAAIRARLRYDAVAFAGWLLVCASMTIGLLMGAYAFDGPLPAPGFIGDYNALPRILLRDAHVILLSLGIVGIAVAATRKPPKA
jgi:hypothetical protein